MTKQVRVSNLSTKSSHEGSPVPLGVCIRSRLRERLQKIAEREDRELDYLVDEILRWAVDEYSSVGSLRNLLMCEAEFSGETEKIAERELDQVRA